MTTAANSSAKAPASYKRNVVTRIYGDFLTRSYNSGVGIDPDYDGEYDIYL